MNINEAIERAEKLDPEIAAAIKKYVRDHAYGLVFEENLPDAVRMYKKTPCPGDVVNILPERGCIETEENKTAWAVKEVNSGTAVISNETGTKEVPVEDLVVCASPNTIIYPGLKEIDRVENGSPDDPYHVLINAENYHALEMLLYAYAGKVDCLYIDPPYNTGAKDWKYNNNYVDSSDKYMHSKWLSFMKRRLELAKLLLNKDDSVLIVTIDEKEYLRLGMLLEQMFPEARIQMISSVINPKGQSRNGTFARTDEYLYVLWFGKAVAKSLPLSKEWRTSESTTTLDIRWQSLRRAGRTGRVHRSDSPGCFYPVFVYPETFEENKAFTAQGLRQGDPDWEKHGIAQNVTWPRTKCTIQGVDINGNNLEGDYGLPASGIDLGYSLPKAAGFKANAVFCELTYESAWPIRLDNAFDAIAPILWMQAGCRGPIIRKIGKSYLTTDYYGVLFNYNQASKFCEKIKDTPSIKTVYVVTDDQRRYSNLCKRLPGVNVHRLYETYLRTFEICGEGGLD